MSDPCHVYPVHSIAGTLVGIFSTASDAYSAAQRFPAECVMPIVGVPLDEDLFTVAPGTNGTVYQLKDYRHESP